MRPEIEYAVGAAMLALGLVLVFNLPPPWWPTMNYFYVVVGICIGCSLICCGLVFIFVGACRSHQAELPSKLVNRWDAMWNRTRAVCAVICITLATVLTAWMISAKAESPVLLAQVAPSTPTSGDCNVGRDNVGSINCHNNNNYYAPEELIPKRNLNDPNAAAFKSQLLGLDKSKTYEVAGVGDNEESIAFALQVYDFMKTNGYKMPEGPLKIIRVYASMGSLKGIRLQKSPNGNLQIFIGKQ